MNISHDNSTRQGLLAAIVRTITSNWAAILLNTVISFVLAPIVVNHLGNVYYGVWTIVSQFTGYLWLFDFGVRESVVKHVAQYHATSDSKELEATVRTAISIYSVVSAVALCAVTALSIALPFVFIIPADAIDTARTTAFLSGATVALSFLTNVFVGVLMGLQRTYLATRFGLLLAIIRAVAMWALLINGYGIVGLSSVQLLIALASGGYAYYLCTRLLPGMSFAPIRASRERVTAALNYGKYVLLANIGDKIIFASDAVVAGVFLPVGSLVPYAIAGTLISHMRGVVMAMASVLNPLASRLHAEEGNKFLGDVVCAGAKAAMITGLPICLGFVVLGEAFVRLWMGEANAVLAGRILQVLGIGFIVGLPYFTMSGVLHGLGRHRIVAHLRLAEAAANLALSVALVGPVGLLGIALGTAVPHMVVVAFLLPAALPKVFPFDLSRYYRQVYLKPILASVPFGLGSWVVLRTWRPESLAAFFLMTALCLVLYVVPVWTFTLDAPERDRIRHTASLVLSKLTPAQLLSRG